MLVVLDLLGNTNEHVGLLGWIYAKRAAAVI